MDVHSEGSAVRVGDGEPFQAMDSRGNQAPAAYRVSICRRYMALRLQLADVMSTRRPPTDSSSISRPAPMSLRRAMLGPRSISDPRAVPGKDRRNQRRRRDAPPTSPRPGFMFRLDIVARIRRGRRVTKRSPHGVKSSIWSRSASRLTRIVPRGEFVFELGSDPAPVMLNSHPRLSRDRSFVARTISA